MLSGFGRGRSGGGSSRRSSDAPPLSLIGADVRITGNIVTEGEIQIDGQLEGDIACRRLLIGETGRITGEITAETTRIHGEVIGKITADAVVVARAARITGDIIHDSVEIEAGARLEGRLIRKSGVKPCDPDPALTGAPEPARLAPPRKKDKENLSPGQPAAEPA